MRILLFDIDGTLLLTNRGGQSALENAMREEFGLPAPCADIHYGGRTDRSIIAELLSRNQLEQSEQNHQRLIQTYQSYLPGLLRDRGGQILPGARELLERLQQPEHLMCYVMTGNLHATATAKLKHFELDHYFCDLFGGDHDHERNDLAARTAEELSNRHGADALSDVIVIGDTPADIGCGHSIGAEVVAVCTGSYDRDALEAENPLAVLDDLSDTQRVMDLLCSPGISG